MNEGISTVEVTEGFQKAVRRGFEDDPRVAGYRRLLEGNGKTQFEGHVESRRAGIGSIELDAGKVVEGIVGGGN